MLWTHHLPSLGAYSIFSFEIVAPVGTYWGGTRPWCYRSGGRVRNRPWLASDDQHGRDDVYWTTIFRMGQMLILWPHSECVSGLAALLWTRSLCLYVVIKDWSAKVSCIWGLTVLGCVYRLAGFNYLVTFWRSLVCGDVFWHAWISDFDVMIMILCNVNVWVGGILHVFVWRYILYLGSSRDLFSFHNMPFFALCFIVCGWLL